MRVLAQKLGEFPFSLFPLPTTQTTHHCARTLMVKPMPTNTNKPTPQPIRVLKHILEDPPLNFSAPNFCARTLMVKPMPTKNPKNQNPRTTKPTNQPTQTKTQTNPNQTNQEYIFPEKKKYLQPSPRARS